MQDVCPTPRSGKGCLLAAFWKIHPSIVKLCKIELDIQHPALDDNCTARLVNVGVTVTAAYSHFHHFHLTSAKWRQVFAVDRLTCRVSKYRIQLLFSPVRILCCLTALLRASYDLRAIWKHSNHRLPNRVSHHLHLVKGLVFQSSFLQLLRKDASQQVTGTSNRRGRAKRQRTISLDSIRIIQMHMYLWCTCIATIYRPWPVLLPGRAWKLLERRPTCGAAHPCGMDCRS